MQNSLKVERHYFNDDWLYYDAIKKLRHKKNIYILYVKYNSSKEINE